MKSSMQFLCSMKGLSDHRWMLHSSNSRFYLTPNPSHKIAGVYEAGVTSKITKFLSSTYRILEVFKEGSVDKFIALKITTNEDDEVKNTPLSLVYDFYTYEGENTIEITNNVFCPLSITDVKGYFT